MPTPLDPRSQSPSGRDAWPMLLALASAFMLSQAWRTVAAIMAPELTREFGLAPRQLGLFAGTFHFAFGALQLVMGLGIDVWGVRRTVLAAFPLAIAGAAVSATAQGFPTLLAGQALIGAGCAPAFLACNVFIARRFPLERFASVSGTVLGLGGIGMLLTGTPLAGVIGAASWRGAFVALGVLSALAWLWILFGLRPDHAPSAADPSGVEPSADAPRETVSGALRGFVALLAMPHTWGILALGAVGYAAFVSLRGLWLGPMLVERYAVSLVDAGNAALAVSLAAMAAAPVFGRLDPGARTRRRRILQCTAASAALFAVLAIGAGAWGDAGVSVVYALLSGYLVFQYADVRAAYPPSMTGRALALFTMAMFLGVAAMQWLTGVVASVAPGWGLTPYGAAMATIAAMLAASGAAFAWLPGPPVPTTSKETHR